MTGRWIEVAHRGASMSNQDAFFMDGVLGRIFSSPSVDFVERFRRGASVFVPGDRGVPEDPADVNRLASLNVAWRLLPEGDTPPFFVARHPRVEAALARLKGLLHDAGPGADELLRATPALADDVACAEVRLGRRLPDDLRAWFAAHERLQPWGVWEIPTVMGLAERWAFQCAMGFEPVWWSPEWIPFATSSTGDLLCIAEEGVIEFLHDLPDRRRVAPCFVAWLEGQVEDLATGRLVLLQDGHGRVDGVMAADQVEREGVSVWRGSATAEASEKPDPEGSSAG
jgi:cell wall assembly regulator SMI1